jgi:hypothetical protein
VGSQVIFLIHINEKKMLLQEMILRIHGPTISFFNSHDEEKMNYTCVVLQMVYSIHICEQKK